jgi:hypothetical protein
MVRIVCRSDTHGLHDALTVPDADASDCDAKYRPVINQPVMVDLP